MVDNSLTHIFDEVGDDYITKENALEAAMVTEDQETIDEVKKILASYDANELQTQNQ